MVDELAAVLLRLDGFRDEQTRTVILDELADETGERPNAEGTEPEQQARSLLIDCVRHPNVLPTLAALLREFHGDSPDVDRFTELWPQVDVATLLTRRERDVLRGFLRPWESGSWRGAFALTASLVPESPRDLPHAVELLEGLVLPPGSVPPLIRFVLALGDRSAPEDRSAVLRWAGEVAARLQIPVTRVYDAVDEPLGGEDGQLVLALRIQPFLPARSEYLLSAWLGHGPSRWVPLTHEDDPLSLDQISARVDDFVAAARDHDDAGPSRVEFMLPRELMNLPVETWSVRRPADGAQAALGELYPVVLRDLERQHDPEVRALWHEKWAWFHRGGGNTLLLDADEPARDEQELALRLRSALTVLVGGTSAWHEHSAAVPPEIDLALDAGVPVMVWHRRGDEESDRFLAGLARTLVAPEEVARLPDRIRRWRRDAAEARQQSFVTSRMALLWDDPEYSPVDSGDFRSPL